MPEEMENFSECFITGTAAEVTPVSEIGPKFTPGDISINLLNDYLALVGETLRKGFFPFANMAQFSYKGCVMGFYNKYVLPRFLNAACGTKPIIKQREKLCLHAPDGCWRWAWGQG